jgi:glycerophosphoryl diester phosphodiesterase
VNAYTVRTWETARSLAALGVDGLVADYPGLFAFDER